MELNWSTFLLEIINFLVLVWILKRFLYQPVLAAIARRQAGIEQVLADAGAQRQQAELLRGRYEGRLQSWDAERQAAREQLHEELQAERGRCLEELQAELQREREKLLAAGERHLLDARQRVEEAALEQAASFAAKLLSDAAGRETHDHLVQMLVDGIEALAPDQRKALGNGYVAETREALVASARELHASQRRALQAAIRTLHGDVAVRFEQDPALIAGVRISVGAWSLAANLQDELHSFVQAAQRKPSG